MPDLDYRDIAALMDRLGAFTEDADNCREIAALLDSDCGFLGRRWQELLRRHERDRELREMEEARQF